MLSGGLNYLSGQWAIVKIFRAAHIFPSYSSFSASVFSYLHLLLCGDGTADGRCFQRQWLWPLWVFSCFLCIWYLDYVRMTPCFWSLRLCQNKNCGLVVKDFILLLCSFLCWNCQKGFCCVQSQQHRLNKCLVSSKYRYCLSDIVTSALLLDCDLNVCLFNCSSYCSYALPEITSHYK